ncbi:putative Transcription elongation factor Spt6 [Seiridium unicorne]|uniref:Transcription elongation factor Spt6 n=1 Tax=Seiridium unicorne TaxID=138068 RepID=A0ABR2UTI3_9PEZI
MSSTMKDLVMGEADEGSSEDESYDEENGETRERAERKRDRNGDADDSSEEEEDDDDEEEAAKVREGFIVDEDEDEEDVEDSAEERKRRKRKRRQEREEEALLDEEDLDLIGETLGEPQQPEKKKMKRLRIGHRESDDRRTDRRGLDDMFSDEEEVVDDRAYARPTRPGRMDDEMDDFIEDDDPMNEEERFRQIEDAEVARPRDRGLPGAVLDTTGLDPEVREDLDAIFGDGQDYNWALEAEELEEDRRYEDQNLELKDVFEPSQLQEKLLTEEDNAIRNTDEPERFQLDRKPFKALQISSEQFKEEAKWITNLIWPKKQLPGRLLEPFQRAIGKVLEYFVVDQLEVPYVFQHRKDYLIHAEKKENPEHRHDPDAPETIVSAEKLLTQDDLWRILELDIKFRAFIERRNALEKTFDNLRQKAGIQDETLEELIPIAESMEELQDLQDYVHFQYSAQLKDLAAMDGIVKETKRPGTKSSAWERTRNSKIYKFVKAYGITADRLAQNLQRDGKRSIVDDDDKAPEDLADSLTDADALTSEAVILQARQMYAEELFANPRMRKLFRTHFYQYGAISCHRTDKGLRKIDESHPFYEIKYLINQTIPDLARRPELFLKMMKAEEEGLVEVKLRLQNERNLRQQLDAEFKSDNYSSAADAWNEQRRKVLDAAFYKLEKIIAKGVKESLRTACQEELLKICREEYSKKLDQAPLKPKGMVLGTAPRVLALSNGMGDIARDPIFWAWVEEDGRVIEQGRFGNLARDDAQRDAFVEVVERRKPDVIAVSGFSADTHKLVRDIEALVSEKRLLGPDFEDDSGDYHSELLDVFVVNDEVARLYKDSPRAQAEHPNLHSVTRYCVGLARFLQSPMKEYATLGKDITSLLFHPCQNLLPQDKLLKYLETSMVDMVNLCGVDINEAVGDSYVANLLPYVAGLGPRKATAVIKAININGGAVNSRDELVGDPDNNKLPVVGPLVWLNCASFLFLEYDPSNPASEPLDNTRVHPEDYELGRKMAADALELDEEDVQAETAENGQGAIVRKLFKEDEQDKVNELILEEYAEQLETKYAQRKRATLETIRAELQLPYEELRRAQAALPSDRVFTMFTGETKESLAEGMVLPVNIRVVKDDFAIVKLDCGIEGRVDAHEVSHRTNVSIKEILRPGQTVQAKILDLNRKDFLAKVSVREDVVRKPYRRHVDHDPGTWDSREEADDREELREKDKVTGRVQRVIKHPMFKPFSSTEAEQYLGSQAVGDLVIRPSSKGNNHLTITWKVADGVFKHVDVLELQKESEFAVGKVLRVDQKYNYTDLDELIVEHIKAMARKVDQLTGHDKFRKGSLSEIEKWLTAYTDANPKAAVYTLCIDPKHPGFFYLAFKTNKQSRIFWWTIKILPNAYEMLKNQYPDMRALTNGFKLRYQSEINRAAQGGRR